MCLSDNGGEIFNNVPKFHSMTDPNGTITGQLILFPRVSASVLIPPILTSAQNCSGPRTCAECLVQAECGWCGDPSDTGRGVCMEGSYRGPMRAPSARGPQNRDRQRDRDLVLDQSLCAADRGYNWAFIQCPGEHL